MKGRGRVFRYFILIMILAVLLAAFAGCKRHKRVTKETETVTLGIDVARYQGTIDWQEVSQSDIDFAMIRVGYRGMADGEITPDPNGCYNMQEAAKAEERERMGTSRYLAEIDWKAFGTKITQEENRALEKFLPVLEGGEFTWIYRSGEGAEPDTYIHDKKQTTIQGIMDEWYQMNDYEPERAVVNSILFADVFGSGEKDMCLLLEQFGWYWIILHEEDGKFYGVDMPIRWFMMVQEDGLYLGSGGASSSYYYRMQFVNGDYIEEPIGDVIEDINGEALYIDGVK